MAAIDPAADPRFAVLRGSSGDDSDEFFAVFPTLRGGAFEDNPGCDFFFQRRPRREVDRAFQQRENPSSSPSSSSDDTSRNTNGDELVTTLGERGGAWSITVALGDALWASPPTLRTLSVELQFDELTTEEGDGDVPSYLRGIGIGLVLPDEVDKLKNMHRASPFTCMRSSRGAAFAFGKSRDVPGKAEIPTIPLDGKRVVYCLEYAYGRRTPAEPKGILETAIEALGAGVEDPDPGDAEGVAEDELLGTLTITCDERDGGQPFVVAEDLPVGVVPFVRVLGAKVTVLSYDRRDWGGMTKRAR
jgi:hypothetical protein